MTLVFVGLPFLLPSHPLSYISLVSLVQELLASGKGDIKLQFEVTDIKLDSQGRVVVKGVEPGQSGPVKYVVAKNLITCGGCYSDRVALLTGGSPTPKIVTFRGTYYQMKAPWKDIVKTNVYPVPSGGGIPVGVHFTPTVNERRGHQMIIGPGACLSFSREGYSFTDFNLRDLWDFATNFGLVKFAVTNPRLSLGEVYRDLNRAAFLKEAQKLVPSVTLDMVEESFAGVMAQVFLEDGTAAKDYIFERGMLGGTTLNVRNAPSPAATASLAIAEKVVDLAQEDFKWKAPADAK